MFFDRQRLAGQGGFIHQGVVTLYQLDIRRNNISKANPDQVPWDKLSRRDDLPLSIPQHPGIQGQFFLEQFNSIISLVLLPETNCRINQKHKDNNAEIGPVMNNGGEYCGNLYHPGYRPPEVGQKFQKRAGLFLSNLIITIVF
jgi:hypothetical protein